MCYHKAIILYVYKSAIIYNTFSIGYSLEKNTIKKLQFAFQFMKENMQKLFFPTKKIYYAFRSSSIRKIQLLRKLFNSALNSSNIFFNIPSQWKKYHSTLIFLNLSKVLLCFKKKWCSFQEKTFQVYIHPIRFPSTLNTFLCQKITGAL